MEFRQNLPAWLRRWCLPSCKISSRSDKGFRFCACAISRIKLFTRLFFRFLGGSSPNLQPRRPHGYWRKIRQTTRFRARMCLFGVAKPKVKLYTPFCWWYYCACAKRPYFRFRFDKVFSWFFYRKSKYAPYFYFRFIWPTYLESVPRVQPPTLIISAKFEVDSNARTPQNEQIAE